MPDKKGKDSKPMVAVTGKVGSSHVSKIILEVNDVDLLTIADNRDLATVDKDIIIVYKTDKPPISFEQTCQFRWPLKELIKKDRMIQPARWNPANGSKEYVLSKTVWETVKKLIAIIQRQK